MIYGFVLAKRHKKLNKSLRLRYEKINIDKMENSALNQKNDFWKVFKKIRSPKKEDLTRFE